MYEFHLSLPVPLHNEVKGLLKLQSEKITDFNDQVFWLKIMFAKSDWWSDVMLKGSYFFRRYFGARQIPNLISYTMKFTYQNDWKWITCKEIVERRHGEPIKFLFLPKMGLLGSQAGNEKNCWL